MDAVQNVAGQPGLPSVNGAAAGTSTLPVSRPEPEPELAPTGKPGPEPRLGAGQSAPPVARSNTPAGPRSTYARWSVNPDTHDIRVQVFDASTGQVLEDIPPETYVARLKDFGASPGSLVDNRT